MEIECQMGPLWDSISDKVTNHKGERLHILPVCLTTISGALCLPRKEG